MWIVGASVLFVIPAYYIARSKGYNGGAFAAVAGVMALLGIYIPASAPAPMLSVLQLALPFSVLVVVFLLKPRRGAPGEKYLSITFSCPACEEAITFERQYEGRAQLCPACGEVVTVPTDEYSPEPAKGISTRPATAEAEPLDSESTGREDDCVVVTSFVNEASAELARTRLESSGIHAFCSSDNCGGMQPMLQVGTGIRILVAAEDEERARDILGKSDELALPDGFVPPPVPPETVPETNNHTVAILAVLAVIAALLLVMAPHIVYRVHSATTAPDYEFVIAPMSAGFTETSRLAEVIEARLKRAGIPCRLVPMQKGQLSVGVRLTTNFSVDSVRALISRRGELQFRLVHKENNELVDDLIRKELAPPGYVTVPEEPTVYRRAQDTEPGKDIGDFSVPGPGYEFMLQQEVRGGMVVYKPFFVHKRVALRGEYLKNAEVGFGALNRPQINIEFDRKGARAFARVTEDYAPHGARNADNPLGRQLAIVLDDTLYSAPLIRQAIYGGRAEISGCFTLAEARLLAAVLGAGLLPCPIEIVEERTL